MKTIKKSVTFTHFQLASHTVENGVLQTVELGSDKLIGSIPQKKLLKQMRDFHQNDTLVVYNVWEETIDYTLDIARFVEVATRVESTPQPIALQDGSTCNAVIKEDQKEESQ